MNKENQIKYILYVRKSTDTEDKQVLSLDSQIDEMKRLAERENLRIVEIITESRSAKVPYNRPEFAKMIQKIADSKANGILCWKLDRLARNPIDGGQISWMLQQGIIQNIKTYDRNYIPSDNVIVMAVELGMANQYIRDLSVNVTRGLRRKASDGWYPSLAPIGYINDRTLNKGQRTIIKDLERFDLVRRIFDYILTGAYTRLQIWRIARYEWNLKTIQGGRLSRSSIYKILTNPFYYGVYEYPRGSGNWYQGRHEPMITKDEFDRVQVILGRRASPKQKNRFFPFTTLIRCDGCGARITAEDKEKKQKNGNTHQYTYYHCTRRIDAGCKQKYVEETELIKQLKSAIEKLTIPLEFHEWAMGELKIAYGKEVNDRNQVLFALQRDYNRQVSLIDSYIEMRANRELTEEEFATKKAEATKEKIRLQMLLEKTDKRIDDWAAKAEKLFNFTLDAVEKFQNGSPEVRREILAYLGSNHKLFNQKLALDLEKPLLYMEGASQEVKAINAQFEPLNNGLDKERLWDSYAKNPLLSAL